MPFQVDEALKVTQRVVGQLYEGIEETDDLKQVKKLFDEKLFASLRWCEDRHSINHARNIAICQMKHQCRDCGRFYFNASLLFKHRKAELCGVDAPRYGYFERKRFHFMCIVCGEEQKHRGKDNLQLLEHMMSHQKDVLMRFGLGIK